MKMTTAQKQDNEIFRRIFEENWEDFKEEHPAFDCDQYEKPVQKMLNCGKDFGGYCEYICMQCGRDLRRICFSCKSCFCLSCGIYSALILCYVFNILAKFSKAEYRKENHVKIEAQKNKSYIFRQLTTINLIQIIN